MLKLFGDSTQWSELKTYDNKRPIDIAAEYGNIEIVSRYLSEHENSKGIRTLIRAAIRHRSGTALSYVQSTYHDEDNPGHYQALHYACRQFYGHQSIKHIISMDEMKAYDRNGYTPLMLAIKHRHVKCLKQLLESDYCTKQVIKISTKSDTKRNVLHICAEVNEKSITDLLLKKCSKLYENSKSNELFITTDLMKNTPFHTCAQNGNVDMCEQMIKSYRESNNNRPTERWRGPTMWTMTNHNKWTALHGAVQNGYVDIVETMNTQMDAADFEEMANIIDEELRSPLHMAAAKGEFMLECSV
jgi:ankyrin repeat protein